MEHLEQITASLQTGAPPQPGSTALKTGEEIAFADARNGKLLKEETDEIIKQTLKYVFIKIGLRAANFPVAEEQFILLNHIRNNYGGHTCAEVRLAFDMAIAGKLEVDVNCFENFSCLYFSTIMNAYREWSAEIHKQMPEISYQKLLQDNTDWRGTVELQFQTFLTDGQVAYKLLPPQFYDQLVADAFIHPDLYKSYLDECKKEICSDLQRLIAGLQMSSKDESLDKAAAIQKQLDAYHNGQKTNEITLRAKQVSVLILFQEAKRLKRKCLYQKVNEP